MPSNKNFLCFFIFDREWLKDVNANPQVSESLCDLMGLIRIKRGLAQ
jgi:hypothetical protein